jgi:hypothetical protein
LIIFGYVLIGANIFAAKHPLIWGPASFQSD